MSKPVRLQKALDARVRFPFQQFGQSGSLYTSGGQTGCTHTVLQYLAYLWLGKWYTHDQISRLVGYPSQEDVPSRRRRGLRPQEVQRFCDKVGLPYKVTFNLTALQVLELSKRGPVGFGHSYSYWPEWQGYHYAGHVSDGKPNGYASPLKHAGRTQLVGFTPPKDAHFGVLLGYDAAKGDAYAWEPNHGSDARPERPAYDFMNRAPFLRLYGSYHAILGRAPYALVPTKSLPL